MRRISLLVFVTSLLVLLPVASAQSIFATLSGSVRDSSGAVVPGASVTVTNVSSGTPYKSTTNREGYFSLTALPAPGTYEVNVEMKGFATWVTKNVELHASDSRSLNIELTVATTTERVEVVTGAEGVAMVDSGEKAYTIQSKDLQELSLVGRNASELVKILPGATLTANGGINAPAYTGEVVGLNSSLGGQTGGLAAVMINGQSAEITQDGQRTMDPGAFGTATPIVPNPDMISEVKVLTSNFTAENAQGPVVMNSVTQSGGKSFHGNLRLNARNTALNSEQEYYRETEIANKFAPGALKPASSYYYPGVSIGGPVIIPGTGLNKSRQKLFFFDGFEYYKQQIDGGVETAFVPTPAMINGDFSALTGCTGCGDRGVVYAKPTTPQPCVAVGSNPCNSGWHGMAERQGCAITNGVMNAACIDPAAQTLMKLETPASTNNNVLGNNYVQSFSVAQNSWQNMVRGDWNLSDNTKAYVTWNRHRETNNMPLGLWAGTCAWCVPSPSGVVGINGADNYTATFLHVFSPTLTTEGKFGYMKLNLPSSPTDPKKIQRAEAGFPLKGYYNTQNLPAVLSWGDSIPSFGDVGHSYHPTMIAVKGIPSVTATVTKVIGTHTTKYGFYWEHLYNKQDNWGQYMGVFQYAAWSASPTGNEYADMLMGMGQAGYFEQAQPPASEVAQNIAAFYAQDDWKLTRRITVQLGMRFEHIAKPYSPGFGLAVFDRAKYNASSTSGNTGVLWHGVDASVPLSGTDSRFAFFSPRVGAAIDVFGTGRTVVRGGWGKFRAYDSVQSNSYTGPAGTALGSVGFACGSNDPACPTWEDVDLHNSANCTPAIGNCAPKAVFGAPQLLNGSFNAIDSRYDEQPLVTSYSLNIDQQLPTKFTLELSYVGNHSDFLQGTVNINGIPLGGVAASCTSASCQQPFRPYNKYQNITGSVTAGKAQFDSMQVSLQRNVGFMSLQANYTWSKALSEGANLNNGSLMGALPDYGTHFLWGISPSDRAQAFSTAYVFRVPNAHSGSSFVNGLANGWEISGITQIESGAQITNQSSGNGLLFGYSPNNVGVLGTPDGTQYPLITCNPTQGLKKNQFANPNCFATPPVGSLGTGSAPYMPGPLFWNTDLTLLKHVKITERQNLEFRFAAFNPLNHSLLSFISGDPNLKLNLSSSGNNPNFGVATAHYGVRILELGVKYLF